MDRESPDGAALAVAQAQLDADYEAIDSHYLGGRLTEYVEASLSLRDRALAIGDVARAAEIVSWMVAAATMSGDPRAEMWASETERLALEAGLPAVLARVERYRSWLTHLQGDPRPMEAAARRSLAISQADGDRQGTVNARRALGEALIEQGRFDEAEAELAQASRLSEEIGDAFSRTEILVGRARLALEREDVEAAEQLASEALAGVRPQDVIAVSAARQALASVRSAQGRDKEAETGFQDALAAIATTEFQERRVEASIAYARFLADRGHLIEAGELLGPIEAWLDERGFTFRRNQIAEVRAWLTG